MKPKWVKIGYGLIVLWMLSPMIPVLICGVIATACGCQVDEGSVHPCLVFGKDIGHTLSVMGMMGWFGLLTFPTGILALVAFAVIVWWRKRSADQD